MDGVYSMDGDYPDLPRLMEMKRRQRALLYVDEAHSLGVMGASGRGICEHFGLDPATATWGWEPSARPWQRGRVHRRTQEAHPILEVHHARHCVRHRNFAGQRGRGAGFAGDLEEGTGTGRAIAEPVGDVPSPGPQHGLDTGPSGGTPIVPVVIGDSMRSLAVSAALLRRGIDAQPILYPAVPENKARVRFFITAEHTEKQVAQTIEALAECIEASKVPVLG